MTKTNYCIKGLLVFPEYRNLVIGEQLLEYIKDYSEV